MSRCSFVPVLVCVLVSGCVGWLRPGGVGYECDHDSRCREGLKCTSYASIMEGTESWALEHSTSRDGYCSDGRSEMKRPYDMGEVIMAWGFLLVGAAIALVAGGMVLRGPRHRR